MFLTALEASVSSTFQHHPQASSTYPVDHVTPYQRRRLSSTSRKLILIGVTVCAVIMLLAPRLDSLVNPPQPVSCPTPTYDYIGVGHYTQAVADAHNVKVDDLLKFNHIRNIDALRLHQGWKVEIPCYDE